MMKKEKHHYRDAFLFVTSSGETSNFLMEDLELILQLELLDSNCNHLEGGAEGLGFCGGV